MTDDTEAETLPVPEEAPKSIEEKLSEAAWRNPAYTSENTIDCEIEHPVFGWLPFTASPVDVEQHGRDIHAAILASGQPITAYLPPTNLQKRQRMDGLTQVQLRLGLLMRGIDTDAIKNVIDNLAIDDREKARIEFTYASTFTRLNPSVILVLRRMGMSQQEIDNFWAVALTL